ncbi:MAG: AraC family transcriptional regulator, partial [Mongoliibacter sp.]|uniref:AraC family transcriptional regulator n=1 Tax=Mongoliibacter sp. TaxID=2022438 RepID=UPI0012F16FAF
MDNKSLIKKGFRGEKMNVIPREILKSHISHEFNKNLYLTDVGYFPQARNHYRKRPQGCSEYILIYCVEGYGTINIEKSKHQLTPHSFYIIKADTPHYYYADEKEPWSIYWVHFSGEFSSLFYKKFTELNNGSHITIPFESNRIAEFEYIIDLINMGISKEVFEYVCILLYKTIGSFLYYSLRSTTKADNSNDKMIEEIKAYLKNNITEKITISKIASEFNKSNSSIFSLFKQKTGYSIIHYFNLLKIQHACELINLSSMPMKEISYLLNFQDPLYFSRLFKKYMGVSPSEYRKN